MSLVSVPLVFSSRLRLCLHVRELAAPPDLLLVLGSWQPPPAAAVPGALSFALLSAGELAAPPGRTCRACCCAAALGLYSVPTRQCPT